MLCYAGDVLNFSIVYFLFIVPVEVSVFRFFGFVLEFHYSCRKFHTEIIRLAGNGN